MLECLCEARRQSVLSHEKIELASSMRTQPAAIIMSARRLFVARARGAHCAAAPEEPERGSYGCTRIETAGVAAHRDLVASLCQATRKTDPLTTRVDSLRARR